jgi:hypothetical protein
VEFNLGSAREEASVSRVVDRPDSARVLRGLKNFQRATVEYVFDRMYGENDCVSRFLVADEVGLGKTLVARGLIAKAVDKLWDSIPRIDVVYVCSNASIARQNINRLNITGVKDIALPSRITLLPARIKDLEGNRLNFVSFTPGTSFNLRSNTGTVEERALLYHLLSDEWKEQQYTVETLLSAWASRESFRSYKKSFSEEPLNEKIRDQFREEVRREPADGAPSLLSRFRTLCTSVGRHTNLDDEQRAERDAIIGELRASLAASCVEALEPDLIILDEFQRFKNLLDGEDEASALARRLFNYKDARVLLLSATPYKMYTMDDEGEDHFADFVQTLSFLYNDRDSTATLKDKLEAYRRELCRFGDGTIDSLTAARDGLTSALRRVVVRTERLAVTADRNGMLKDVPPRPTPLLPTDVEHYLGVQRVSSTVDAGEAIEYWKSAPYLLNFMDDYDLKRRFGIAALNNKTSGFFDAVSSASSALLSRENIDRYQRIDPANIRLRSLIADLDDSGAWDVCWIPPAMPYYESAGPFASAAGSLTKRLIFSAWQVVPKTIAALLSYESERRSWAGEADPRATREKAGGTLRFNVKDGKPASMSVLGLIYPSFTLAAQYDPMTTAQRPTQESGGTRPSIDNVIRDTAVRLEEPLRNLGTGDAGPIDERWYWAAPVLLDLIADRDAARRWLFQSDLKETWRRSWTDDDSQTTTDGWNAHVDELRRIVDEASLGSQPPDLAEVIAYLAVAGFGVTALRALARVTGGLSRSSSIAIRNAAGPIADGLLSIFNLPETEAAVQRYRSGEPYWRRTLEYSAAGGLQAVFDEYAHILVDSLGVQQSSGSVISSELSKEMSEALRTRTANIGVDYIDVDAVTKRVRIDPTRGAFRSRFAARFGARATEEGASAERDDVVRRAFNSPFWPFVLCSTSVGQEGLDFHQYCHAVVHWNVPSNPVDLEQREGRVHRYKNHAVRKNVAAVYAPIGRESDSPDPWREAFREAEKNRVEQSDLTPYWIFVTPNGAQIERHIPLYPLSADANRADRVRRALTVYRLAFGQSRQEDLVTYLSNNLSHEQVEKAMELFRIDLSPPPVAAAEARESDLELTPDEPEYSESSGDQRFNIAGMRDLLNEFAQVRKRTEPELSIAVAQQLLESFERLSAH